MYDDKIGNNINPIVYTSKEGFFIDGQKTTQKDTDKYNRVHIMRVGLFIKKMIYSLSPDFFWKPVTSNTRADFKSAIENQIFKVLVEANAIKKDYAIYVEELNDVEIETDNGMVAMMEWTPIGSVEKIKVISTMINDVVTTEIV
jgi:phage tail sheath protein FI